jgi:hypothetical protein
MSQDEIAVKAAPANPYDLPPLLPEQVAQPYWVGTLPTCPQYNVAIGGIMFHRYTDPPVSTEAETGETKRAYGKGSVEQLTARQVEAIKVNLKNKVVRFHGNSGRGSVHNSDNARYFVRAPEDQPLARHVYMIAFDPQAMGMRSVPQGGYPPSVYEMAGGAPISAPSVRPQADIAPEIEDLDKPEGMRHRPPQLAGKKER